MSDSAFWTCLSCVLVCWSVKSTWRDSSKLTINSFCQPSTPGTIHWLLDVTTVPLFSVCRLHSYASPLSCFVVRATTTLTHTQMLFAAFASFCLCMIFMFLFTFYFFFPAFDTSSFTFSLRELSPSRFLLLTLLRLKTLHSSLQVPSHPCVHQPLLSLLLCPLSLT